MMKRTQIILQNVLSKHSSLQSDVSKGEHTLYPGSRGGHVIGYTKSNKPIYSADSTENRGIYKKIKFTQYAGKREGQFAKKAHPTYTDQDHRDAAELHLNGGNQTDDSFDHLYRRTLGEAHLEATKIPSKSAK